ncbi:MAG: hypothetical protein LBG65_00700 [Puniceicoccales bacterium]|jgi:hypothetical protein|nr:hypothetical protein [Puniceicoccales bacterium]
MKTVLCSILLTAVAVAFTGCEKKAEKKDDAKKPATEQPAKAPDAAAQKP